MRTMDLNSDVGEGLGNESDLMPYLSSCNIACGLHAGDDETIEKVIGLAITHQVAVGAHPSFDDRENFGRREMKVRPSDLYRLLLDQILKVKQIAEAQGVKLSHVKPHGALYNMAAKSSQVSETVIRAVSDIGQDIVLFGLAGSETEKIAKGKIRFAPEGFADRRYQGPNQLMSRHKGGLLEDLDEIRTHVANLVLERKVETPQGIQPIEISTICVHGDSPSATKIVKIVHDFIREQGAEIKPAHR